MRLFFNSLGGGSVGSEQLILSGITYPNDIGEQPGLTMLSTQLTYQAYPHIIRVMDKTFIAFTSPMSDLNKGYMYVYDHFRGKVSSKIYLGITSQKADIHHFSAISIYNEQLLIQQDIKHGGSSVNQSLSGGSFDLLNWTNAVPSIYGADKVYPHFTTTATGIVNIIRYGSWTKRYAQLQLYIFSNGSWASAPNPVIDLSDSFTPTNSEVPYHSFIPSNDGIIRMWININRGLSSDSSAEQYYRYGAYIESTDGGVTWSNAQGTFSKDINSSGAITGTELLGNCAFADWPDKDGTGAFFPDILRVNSGTYGNGNIFLYGGAIGDKKPHCYVYDGSNWSVHKVNVSGKTLRDMKGDGTGTTYNNATYSKYIGGVLYYYAVYENGGTSILAEFKSNDNGVTWVFIRDLTPNNLDVMNIAFAENDPNLFITEVKVSSDDGKIYIGTI